MREALPLLLGRKWLDRKKGDLLLLDALPHVEGEDPDCVDPWPEEIQALLRSQPKGFIPALVAFWADQSAEGLVARMKHFGKPPVFDRSTWQSPHVASFPLDDKPVRDDFDMYGLWIARLIHRAGPAAAPARLQLIACLQHPEPVVVGAAIGALGSMGPAASDALPALLDLALGGDLGRNPRLLPRAVARIAGEEPLFIEGLAGELAKAGPGDRIHGACAILSETPAGQSRGLTRALEALEGGVDTSRDATLCRYAVLWAEHRPEFHARLLAEASRRTGDADDAVRAWAVGACARLVSLDDDAALLRYANDPNPDVRGQLCTSLAGRGAPSGAVMSAVARNLGDAMCDGWPHDAALDAICSWGAVARGSIEDEALRWIDEYIEEGYGAERTTAMDACRLASAVGGERLVPALRLLESAVVEDLDEPEIDLEQPEGFDALKSKLEQSALRGGMKDGAASEYATGMTELARRFIDALPAQDEIDAREARQRAEMEAMFGADAMAQAHDAMTAPAPEGEDLPDHLVLLRETIAALTNRK